MATRARSRGVKYRAVGTVVLALALVATACSDPVVEREVDSGVETVEGTRIAGADLSNVTIDSSSFEELDVVRFSGIALDSDMSGLVLQGITETLDPMDMLLFLDDRGLYTIFPLHPENPGGGGEIVLQLSSDDGNSQEFDVTVSGLPEAPGAWDRTVEALLEAYSDRAAQLGTTLPELAESSVDDLSYDAAVLKLAAGLTEDGSAHDLESLLVRPGDEFAPDAVNLVDSMMAKLGVEQFLPSPLGGEQVEALGANYQGASLLDVPTHVNAQRAVFAQSGSCRRKDIPLSNGDELAAAISKGLAARDTLNDPLYQFGSDAASSTAALGGVVAVIGVATGVLAAPALTVAAGLGAVSTVAATHRLFLEADAGNYPTSFVELRIAVDRPEFNEDFREDGHVTKVDVIAASTGFNAAKTFSGIAASAIGAGIGTGIGAARGAAAAANDVSEAGFGMLAETHIANETQRNGGLFEFCAQRWTVGINDSRFVRAWTTDGNIEVNETTFDYKPTEVGDDTLWMETLPLAFPRVSAITSAALVTNSLEVVANPTRIKVKQAGETVAIGATLVHADTWTLGWETTDGSWADGLAEETESRVTQRQLKTPTDKDLYPITVTMTSKSTTGLRADATDERTATVIIELRKLIVIPDPGGVLVEKTRQFTATDDKGQPREVRWEATGGSIDGSGLYTAGKDPGAYTVTATANDDPNITESVVVNVTDICLVGTWLLRSQDFFDQVGAEFGGKSEYRSGENRLIVRDDGTYTSVREAWSFGATTDEAAIVFVIDAENFGTWTATDVDVSIQETGGDEVSVQTFIEVGGQLQPLPLGAGQLSVPSGAIATTAPYLCDAGELATLTDGVTSIFDRVDG